jgi:tetratricopeptide (TPR) repeat protein
MTTKGKVANKELEMGDIVSRSEQFIEKYQKNILYGIVIVAFLAGAVLWIRHGYLIPQEKKAAAALFRGELYFGKDSFALALHGNGADYPGFESIISDYGMTKSGNLAKAYAGICYYRLGETEKAIEQLKSFRGKDKMLSPTITGLIGDCYVNAGKVKEGIGYFKKAAKQANNELISPTYLKKAGIAYENLEQYNDAVKVYVSIKENYYNSEEASDIDKYITRASELAKK